MSKNLKEAIQVGLLVMIMAGIFFSGAIGIIVILLMAMDIHWILVFLVPPWLGLIAAIGYYSLRLVP